MIKKSTFEGIVSESCRRWNCNTKIEREWTYEGERKRFTQVAIDGNCTRKNAERIFVRTKRTYFKSIRVAPR